MFDYVRSRVLELRYRFNIPDGLWPEWKKLCKLAIPLTFTTFIDYLICPVSLMFCGRIGKTELAAAGLAIVIFHIAGLSVIFGLMTASETLFAQTFGGENKFRLGIQMQRACCILLFCCMPCWAIHLCIEPILLGIKQPPYIARLVSDYLLGMMPALLFIAVTSVLSKYVQAQKRVYIPLMAGICGNCSNAMFHYLLISHTNIGFIGSAISQSLAYASQMIFLILYIKISKLYRTTFDGFHVELWHDWGLWFRLGIPGMMMSGLEWWVCESGNLLSGYLGEKDLAAQSILNNIASVVYFLIPLGFAIAATIRIGHFLGADNEKGPRATVFVALLTVGSAATFNFLLLTLLRHEIPKIFSPDPDIISLTGESLPSVIVFQFFDAIVGVIAGMIRGAGLQKIGAIVCIVCMYGVGAPTGLCLMLLTKLGISGFWWGLSVAGLFQVIIYSIILSKLDWNVQCNRARKNTTINLVRNKGEISVVSLNSDTRGLTLEDNDGVVDEESTKTSISTHADPNTITVQACTPRLVLNRFLLLGSLFSILFVSLCCRLFLDWGEYFPCYCLLLNRTLVPIPSKSTRYALPESYQWLNTDCLALLPS